MAFQYIDFNKNYLVGLDSKTGKVFHNSTLIALHGMYLTQ